VTRGLLNILAPGEFISHRMVATVVEVKIRKGRKVEYLMKGGKVVYKEGWQGENICEE
jgi:hypothetical protein